MSKKEKCGNCHYNYQGICQVYITSVSENKKKCKDYVRMSH